MEPNANSQSQEMEVEGLPPTDQSDNLLAKPNSESNDKFGQLTLKYEQTSNQKGKEAFKLAILR